MARPRTGFVHCAARRIVSPRRKLSLVPLINLLSRVIAIDASHFDDHVQEGESVCRGTRWINQSDFVLWCCPVVADHPEGKGKEIAMFGAENK